MLVPIPLENQLQDVSSAGLPDTNANNNCVPTTLAAAGKALVGWRYSGGDLTAAVYGEGYKGPTDPLRFSAFLTAHGIAMLEVRNNDGNALVATVKAELAKGHPVYGAIASMWGLYTGAQVNAQGLPSHAIVFCDARNDTLTAMNPWPVDGHNAFYQTMPASWWASRLCYSHVIVLSRTGAAPTMPDPSSLDLTGLGAGMADYARTHGVSQVGGGEHYYTPDDSFCGLSDGNVLWYNRASGLHDHVGAWVAAVLWQQREAFRQLTEQQAAQLAVLKAQLTAAAAHAAPPPPPPPPAPESAPAAVEPVALLPANAAALRQHLARALAVFGL